ncbi:MAG: formate dehydrogenase accessory sulfurtransferase FdhD [Saprospiraceae bacterium]|nr:formate dehydrogenase accessory sulfurtransferase FdhD [Saprospiraceae bacterium]
MSKSNESPDGNEQGQPLKNRLIFHFQGGQMTSLEDAIAIEEPIHIYLRQGRLQADLGFLMRTPGHDEDLVTGLMYSEQVINQVSDIAGMRFVQSTAEFQVALAPEVPWPSGLPERSYTATTACGVCGRTTMDQLLNPLALPYPEIQPVSAQVIENLPDRIRGLQNLFKVTGGVHAAALCDRQGNVWCLREDVGRHNAVDKLIGSCIRSGKRNGIDGIMVVSGRLAFELVQKAIVFRCPVLVAVGAPTTQAVELAEQYGMTLVGFTGQGRFNVYTHPDRIVLP